MALAYPNLDHSSRETFACDYFVDALEDADFALKVRERMLVTLDDALRYALRLEAWMKNADQVRRQNRSSSQKEPVRHKLKGRGATGCANQQPLDVGRLAEMIESTVERSINGRLNTPKSTVTKRLKNSRVQDDGLQRQSSRSSWSPIQTGQNDGMTDRPMPAFSAVRSVI